MKREKPTGKRRECNATILCEWCGQHKESSRGDTKTCSTKCRTSLHRFVKIAGFPPDDLPGDRTPQEMFDLLVNTLLIREKARRELEKANNLRAAQLLYGDGPQAQAAAKSFPKR